VTGTVYLTLDEFIDIAGLLLGIEPQVVRQVADLGLADSALHAPQAGFGETEFYPTLAEKAAVLGWHLAMNHPLPDGNKRAAFLSVIEFVESNGAVWIVPNEDDAVEIMWALAAGKVQIGEFTDWVGRHIALV
jgi:death on curing protein